MVRTVIPACISLITDLQFITQFIVQLSFCIDIIIKLSFCRSLLRLAIDVDNLILDFQFLIWQTHTAFYIVFTTIYWTTGDFAKTELVLRYDSLAHLV